MISFSNQGKNSNFAGNKIAIMTNNTNEQFDAVVASCRQVFVDKLKDYGASWRVFRPSSLTDQLFTKTKRIRTLETTGENRVGEGIVPELMALVNYGIIGMIQLEKGCVDTVDMTAAQAIDLYDRMMASTRELMLAKNHDYGEAWRDMRVTSYTDFILTKINRIKEIEDNQGCTHISEGIDSNYQDIINYAIFGLIRYRFA